jgi:cytochrome c biogenesis protein CcdA
VVLPFLLLILSVVRQQRDVWYILYVVLFAFGMVYSNLACQHAIEEDEKPKPFTKRVINAACVANVLTGFVFLSISIPVLQPRDGMGFQTIRGVAFVATMLLLFIPLTNTSVLPAKLRDDPKLFLEMGARFIITTAAIVDLTA